MSQQTNKVIKKQRRLAYQKRRKARIRQARATKTTKA